jgi:hypothetical protein
VKITRMKWWKLKGDISQVFTNRVIAKRPWNEGEDADNMWKEMTAHMRKVTIEVFGVIRGNKCESKDTWWWNDDVQKVISEKKECYKRLYHNMSDENIQNYKKARRNAKKAVSETRGQAYAELYRKLDTKMAKMISTRWLNFEKERQETSTKLNVLRMRLIGFW